MEGLIVGAAGVLLGLFGFLTQNRDKREQRAREVSSDLVDGLARRLALAEGDLREANKKLERVQQELNTCRNDCRNCERRVQQRDERIFELLAQMARDNNEQHQGGNHQP
ncbi:MAG: hypothetical protein AB7U18_21605 [Dehalococcoidia bacterium]